VKVTADTITDEQIRELRLLMAEERTYERWPDGAGSTMNVADLALQRSWSGETISNGVSVRFPTPSAITAARARCAEILNARAKEKP
jgi:hypothetical protein